ncbi:hypothetical protein D8S78_20535 [Natrialba swarupiae]|nr:hypothetical protein [Natrialba swarupiae]
MVDERADHEQDGGENDGGRSTDEELEFANLESETDDADRDESILEYTSDESTEDGDSAFDERTLSTPESETIFARPPLQEVEPIGVQWYGRAERNATG